MDSSNTAGVVRRRLYLDPAIGGCCPDRFFTDKDSIGRCPARYGCPEISAAGDAHMAADARAVVPAIDNEVMALRFQADGAVDRRAEKAVVGGGPQRFAQVGGILVAEAGMQRAGTGDPHPIAGLAEI